MFDVCVAHGTSDRSLARAYRGSLGGRHRVSNQLLINSYLIVGYSIDVSIESIERLID